MVDTGMVDRLLEDARHGKLQRSLAALTAVGSVVTAGEIFFEHDRASFGNPWMWAPIVLGPVGAIAGVAGFCSPKLAKTLLPLASTIIIANGVQGFFLHVRGVGQKPGGWRNARYNLEMGPPVFAPLLVTMVGGIGLLGSIMRRES